MKLAKMIEEKNILIHMESQDYRDAIGQLLETLGDELENLDREKILERLIEVEDSLPVSPGHGVRIPHARLGGLHRMLVAIGTSPEGVPMHPDDPDSERAHIIFLLLAPKTQSTLMLQTMSSVARLVASEENRKALVSTTAPARLLKILEESGIEVKKAIMAADLMNMAKKVVEPDMTLRQVCELLANSDEEGLPVIDSNNDLVGDISTRMLIQVGLPRYLNLVSDSRVLSEFEPFEVFYKKEDEMRAHEIMNSAPLTVNADTPVEILAHEMLANQCERAYVTNEKKLVGVVYRKDIVRKVLNL
ncbi:MAG: PTS sugar transporter subunit IIA [Candidatus Sumerlaeota bacterium]